MTHYIDMNIKTKKSTNWIMNSLFKSLHLRLVTLNCKSIGVSFPKRGNTLGSVLRIHGTAQDLLKLNEKIWFKEKDIRHFNILEVPEEHTYINVSRKQPKMNNSKLNRLIKRNNLSREEVLKIRKDMLKTSLDNNFVEIESGSNKNMFKLFFSINKSDNQIKDVFDFYGLSKKGTVPLF